MKNLIALLCTCSILNSQGQDVDLKYYLFAITYDYSITSYHKLEKRIEKQKLNFSINKLDTGRVLRLSEATGLKLKTQRKYNTPSKFYELKNVPCKLSDLYNFTCDKQFKTWQKKIEGSVKNEIIENATEHQMKSFLAGIYFQYGSTSSDTIKFQFGHINEKLEITKLFIERLGRHNFFKIIPTESKILGGGPLLLLIPNNNLKTVLFNERDRINTLANKKNL